MKLPPIQKKWGHLLCIGSLLILSLTSCTTLKPAKTAEEIRSWPQAKVTLGPGDALDVKFFNVPEINESQIVRPDGKINLQLVGEVSVWGRTPSELQNELVRLYTPELKTPKLTVTVRSLANRRVYVGGLVQKPGVIEMPHQLTVLEAIMQAGGFDDRRAAVSKVLVIRHRDGKRYGAVLDFKDALRGMEFQSLVLEPQDIIYVHRKSITEVALFIDQYITSMMPRLGLTWLSGPGGVTFGVSQPTYILTPP